MNKATYRCNNYKHYNGKTIKKKTPLKRISKRGLQAPGCEGWENLSGDKFHRLKRHNNDFWYMNYKHNENIEHMFE